MSSGSRVTAVGIAVLVTALAGCREATSPVGPSTSPTPAAAAARPASSRGLVINEIMADPARVADNVGEWLEIHNFGADAVDLAGWRVESRNDGGATITESVVVPPGGYVVLGRNADEDVNGGVRVDFAYGSAVALANGTDWVALVDPTETEVDRVEWTSTVPSGRARGVRNPADANDDLFGANWTTRTTPYGLGDRGTPSTQNDGYTEPPDPELVVRVLDVGQGDAVLVTNGGSTVLIDGGPGTTRLGRLLDSLGLNNSTIDAVIVSHGHADHYNGLRELFRSTRNITVRYLWENQDPSPNVTLRQLRDSINARVDRGELVYRDADDPCADGTTTCDVLLRGGAVMHLLGPMAGDGDDQNNRSGAVKLVGPDSASFTMWLAGDAEREAIGWFLGDAGYASSPGMAVNVLKADHHGSCNGLTPAYLTAVAPTWTIMSLASSNPYGHVHNQTKDLLAEFGIPWYRTDQNGTVEIRSPGTPGGGYTVSVQRGWESMSGPSDREASATTCPAW